MSENILIITYDMIPYSSWGSSQRMFLLGNSLSNDFNVFTICAKKEVEKSSTKEMKFDELPLENIQLLTRKKKNKKNNKHFILDNILNYLKDGIIKLDDIFFNEPNSGMGIRSYVWSIYNQNSILNFIKKNNIKRVIISGPPFGLFKLSKVIKKRYKNIKLILDYRDPWSLWNGGTFFSNKKENEYLNYADKIIFFSDLFKKDMINRYNLVKDNTGVVYNGYSKEVWEKINVNKSKKEKKLIISHIGSLDFENETYRNPSKIIKSFKKFPNKNNIILKFVGVKENRFTEKLKNEFGDSIEFFERVSHQKALEHMISSDVVFLLHTDNNSSKYIIPGKFFDYLKSGNVIWGIGNKNSAFNKLIDNHKLGVSSSNELKDILNAFHLFYDKWTHEDIKSLRKDRDIDISFYSREFQNKNYRDIIKQL